MLATPDKITTEKIITRELDKYLKLTVASSVREITKSSCTFLLQTLVAI